MKNKKINNILLAVEVTFYAILMVMFAVMSFFDIDKKIANALYIAFITVSFGWLFACEFFFKRLDNAVHFKMFKKYYIPVSDEAEKKKFKRKGIKGVIFAWVVYLSTVALLKFLNVLTWQVFLCCGSLMFLLNSIFARKCCLLSKMFLHNKNDCCKNCSINSWDYSIFASALFFAPKLSAFATALNFVVISVAFVILVMWEYNYHKYPYRFYMETNKSLSCKYCLKQCNSKVKCITE